MTIVVLDRCIFNICIFFFGAAHSNDDDDEDEYSDDEYEEESSNMDESLQNGPATLGCLTVKGKNDDWPCVWTHTRFHFILLLIHF